jgi:hypothetical protein
MTAVTNIVCTGCIGFKLWMVGRSLRGVSGSRRAAGSASYRALVIIVESAAVWTLSMVAFLIVYLSGSNGQYVILDFAPSLIGINFSAIIIRISLGTSNFGNGHPASSGSGGPNSVQARQVATIGGSRRFVGTNDVELASRGTGPVSVTVDKFVHVEGEDAKHGYHYSPDGHSDRSLGY